MRFLSCGEVPIRIWHLAFESKAEVEVKERERKAAGATRRVGRVASLRVSMFGDATSLGACLVVELGCSETVDLYTSQDWCDWCDVMAEKRLAGATNCLSLK